jgi:hypothetical protein
VQPAGAPDAFQLSAMLVVVWLGDARPVGVAGIVVHPPPMLTTTAALWAETLPAASRARTVKEYVVLA